MKTEEKKKVTKKKNTSVSSKKKQDVVAKKSSNKKQKIVTKKSNSKKQKEVKNKFSFKLFITSTKTLLVIFCILLAVVVGLFTLVLQKRQEKLENPTANMVIPIYKESTGYHFSVSAVALSKRKNYIFKVTNYKDKIINSNDVHYQVTIDNPTDSKLKLVKGDDSHNLMKDEKNNVIDGGVLSHEEKKEDIYYLTMDSYEKLEDKDFIRIEVSLVDNQEN